MIDLLVLVHLFVDLGPLLKSHRRPEQVPVILVCLLDVLRGENLLQDLGFGVDEFEVGWLSVLHPGNVKHDAVS